jgi:hypothetical protein
MFEEILEAERVRGERLPIMPLVELYDKENPYYFLDIVRDYIWFDEKEK